MPLDVAPYSLLRDTKLVSCVYDRLVYLPLDCDRHYVYLLGARRAVPYGSNRPYATDSTTGNGVTQATYCKHRIRVELI